MAVEATKSLPEKELDPGLKSVIKDGLTSQTMGTLVGGAFLVDFALKLGASNFIIGVIAAITPLAQLLQMPSVYLVERYQKRRAITVAACSISRMSWLAIALIPLALPRTLALPVLLFCLFVYAAFAAVGTCSWNSWMRDLIPENRLGTFFAKRATLATALGILVSLSAGYFVDYWKKIRPGQELTGYAWLFTAGMLAGMLGVYFISQIPEPPLEPAEGKLQFFLLIRQPLKDKNFKNLLLFLGPWNFAVNLATPFFTVYMLKTLGLALSTVIWLTVVNQFVTFAFLGIWGNYSDRFNNKAVLSVNGILLLLCIFGWTFTGLMHHPASLLLLLGVIQIFMGISNAGVSLASGNIGLKLAPRGSSTAYLATITIINSLAAGIAPLLGGTFADFFTNRELSWTLTWSSPKTHLAIQTLHLQHWDFFFFMAFLIGLYSIHRLALVKEKGEGDENTIVRELMLDMQRKSRRVLYSLASLRLIFQFPFVLANNVKAEIRHWKPGRSEANGSASNGPANPNQQ